MSDPIRKMRSKVNLLAALAGVALCAFLVFRIGPAKLASDTSKLGWWMVLVIALGGVVHIVRAWAWRLTLTGEQHRVSFARLLQLRLISEAAGQLGALGQAFGEGIRVSALTSEIPAASRISSVTLDRGMFIASGAIVTLIGVVASPFVLTLPPAWRSYTSLFAVALVAFLLTLALALRRRWPIFSGPARLAKKVRRGRRWLESRELLIRSIEDKLFEFHHGTPAAFWSALGLNLFGHALAILEVYLILQLMGASIAFVGALIFEALTKVVNIAGSLNPGNIGTYEAGNVLIARAFGLGSDSGLILALARRLRAIFWAAIGAVCMMFVARSKNHHMSEGKNSELGTQPTPVAKASSPLTDASNTAIVLAGNLRDDREIGGPLSKVGTLPVILRTILGITKAGANRIVICVDSNHASHLRRKLLATGRLPENTEWWETAPASGNFKPLLGHLAGECEEGHLLLIAGDTTYRPALFRDATAWSGSEPLAITCSGRPIGIWSVPSTVATILTQQNDSIANSDELYSSLMSHSRQHKEVSEDDWQQVLTLPDRISAENKLDSWLVKPTDGIFARLNRRISIPISRQLIKWPITPNMVSLFTLGVGLVSGVSFAKGGYWNTLFAAVLSLWASILDGSDGEVARLKLLESDFGCWLETVCDYLYYLFIFSGMAIGLVRTLGPKYMIWTGLLLFGAVTTFLVTGMGRRRLARGRPEQYLAIWQAQAESRRANPIFYIGRYAEFMVRRCFLPYAILVFAALNITNVVLVLAAIGANCAWLISLYSYRRFSVAPASSPASYTVPSDASILA